MFYINYIVPFWDFAQKTKQNSDLKPPPKTPDSSKCRITGIKIISENTGNLLLLTIRNDQNYLTLNF